MDKKIQVGIIDVFAVTRKLGLDHLADLAHRDDEIFEGVKNFYNEYLMNILGLFKQSASKLPKKKIQKRAVLEVCAPIEIPDDISFSRNNYSFQHI